MVATAAIKLAYLDRALDFSWAWASCKRPTASAFLLRRSRRGALSRGRIAEAAQHPSFYRGSNNDRHLRGLGDSLLAGHAGRGPGAELVGATDRPPDHR